MKSASCSPATSRRSRPTTSTRLTALIHEDATQSMPPYDLWLTGRDDIFTWWFGPGIGCKGSRVIPTVAANGSPAFGQYKPSEDGRHEPWALQVLELSDGRIAELTFFLDTERLFPLFGLPLADRLVASARARRRRSAGAERARRRAARTCRPHAAGGATAAARAGRGSRRPPSARQRRPRSRPDPAEPSTWDRSRPRNSSRSAARATDEFRRLRSRPTCRNERSA